MDTGITFISNRLKLELCLFLFAFLLGCGNSNDDITCRGSALVKAAEDFAEDFNVTGLPEGTGISPTDTGCADPYSVLYEISSSESDKEIFEFYLDGLVDLSNVLTDRNDEASFVYFSTESDKSGLTSLYLHIPCAADAIALLVCPGVVSLEMVTDDCAGSVTLTSEAEVGNYQWINFGNDSGECIIGVSVENLGAGFGAKAL